MTRIASRAAWLWEPPIDVGARRSLAPARRAFRVSCSRMQRADPFGWVGSTIDNKVAIEAVAGEGGFGVVYRGTHLSLKFPVAVKCLRVPPELELRARDDLLARAREEARILHNLSRRSANIVQALDIGAATAPSGCWTPYIVMEWLEGETLASELQRHSEERRPPRGLEEAIRLLAPAAGALSIAHEEKVSHRDIKPANLFLARSGAATTVKILDFGIARLLTEATLQSAMRTQEVPSLQPFTPQYGAPEHFSGQYGGTGPWTDVFAMALILIEVASGQPALRGYDLIQLYQASTEEHRRASLRERGVEASPAVEAVVSRALAATVRHRYRDMSEMWSALTTARGAAPRPASPPPPRPPEPPSEEAPPIATTGKNRVCTMMSIDLLDAANLSARLDPEDVREIADRGLAVVKDEVAAMGGVVEVIPGSDRVLALFGVPRATDNDAERAVLAALRVQAAIARVKLPRSIRGALHDGAKPADGGRLSVRIGINTGRVFVESIEGSGRASFRASGDAIAIAHKLEQAAPHGGIAVGRDTYRQVVRRFEVIALPPIEIPGRDYALPVYQVRGAIAFRPAVAATEFHGAPTKLVGRAAEMARLTDALETAMSDRRAAILTLVGAPGVGRSRMLSSFFSHLAERPEKIVVMAAQCSPLLQSTSFGLAALLVRHRFGLGEDDAPEVVKRKLERGLRWLRLRAGERFAERERGARALDPADLEDAVRQMQTLLGASPVSLRDSMSIEEIGNPAKHRIFEAAARLLCVAVRSAPVVILCDDIQWADDASLELLDELFARAEDTPALAVCAARPELFERLPEHSHGKAAHARVDLAPLARRHVEEMIRDLLARVRHLPPSAVRTLADRAEGHPLTLVETLHLLIDVGVIVRSGDDAWTMREADLGAISLPATVQGIVQARLDRLDPSLRGVLERAAVVGRTFWPSAIVEPEARSAEEATTVDVAALESLLSRLRDKQLIRLREPSAIPGEREYAFAESAIYEVLYETLSVKVRRPLHLAIARWLEGRQPGHTGHALLALHYDRGGAARLAAAAYGRAAVHAALLGENAEALRHYERARDLHDEVVEELGEEGVMTLWYDSVRLRLELADVLRRLGRLDEAEGVYEAARARIHRPNNPSPIDRADALRFEARVDYRVALLHKVRGATALARPLVERAILRAHEAGAAADTPPMYALLAFIHRREGRPEASWRAACEGLRVSRAMRDRDERWHENVTQLLFGIGAALFARKRPIGAERSYRQATRVISETASPYLAGIAWNGVGAMRFVRGDIRGARPIYQRALRLKERAGDLHQIAVTCTNLAEVELALDNAPLALEHARRAVRLSEQARAASDLAAMYRNLADVLLRNDHLEEALSTARKALSTAEASGRPYLVESAKTLTRAVARAAGVPSLRPMALEAAESLRASLSAHFTDGELRAVAEECLASLSKAFESPSKEG